MGRGPIVDSGLFAAIIPAGRYSGRGPSSEGLRSFMQPMSLGIHTCACERRMLVVAGLVLTANSYLPTAGPDFCYDAARSW